jgi:putative peptidoglycan lipid II flippase
MSSTKIFKNTLLFSAFVLLAQVFGLVRDLYLAKVFGVSQILDTYYLAFKIPDFLNIFYSVFLGSVIFIPLLTKLKNSGGEVEMQKKINSVGSLVLFSLVFVFIVLEIFMPQLTRLLAPTWSQADLDLLTQLSRVLLVAQFFFPIGILGGAIGMVYNKPFGMAVSGFIYNFGILIGAVLLVPFFGIYGLAFSVIFGALLFMLVQIWNSHSFEFIKNFRIYININEWLGFVKENVGRFVAVLAYQLYGIIILSIATLSGTGGVSAFSIAYNLYLAAFFVLGASFSTVLMPRISDTHVKGEREIQKKNLQKSLWVIFLLSLVASLIMYFASILIVKILYYYSNITLEQEIYIGSLLTMLSVSLPFFNALEILRKYFYSTEQIFLASLLTVLLVVGVCAATYLLNIFSSNPILTSLILGINISMFLTTIFMLSILKYKKQI